MLHSAEITLAKYQVFYDVIRDSLMWPSPPNDIIKNSHGPREQPESINQRWRFVTCWERQLRLCHSAFTSRGGRRAARGKGLVTLQMAGRRCQSIMAGNIPHAEGRFRGCTEDNFSTRRAWQEPFGQVWREGPSSGRQRRTRASQESRKDCGTCALGCQPFVTAGAELLIRFLKMDSGGTCGR